MQNQVSRLLLAALWYCAFTSKLLAQTQLTQTDAANTKPSSVELAVKAVDMQPLLDGLLSHLSGRFQASTLPSGQIQLQGNSEAVIFDFRPTQNQLRITGPASITTDILKLSAALTQRFAGQTMLVLSLDDQGRTTFNREAVFTAPSAAPLDAVAREQRSVIQLPQFLGFRRVQLAAAQQEVSDSGTPAANATPADPQDNRDQNKLSGLPLQQFDGVQVEMLPEIDAIILRGRDKQLADLAEIIKQLDDASRQAQPEIEVLILQHVNSQSLGTLIQTTQQNLLANRQGKVSVAALNNPNAMLLIGWGDALKIAKDLIAKLDQPVPPSSTFEVIQLKYAVASQVQLQLENFFKSRTGLSPVIQSAADPRTNAIIVHAAPRDLEEIRKLIEQLDLPRGQASQQARVFQIRNSLADDVAAALRQALASPGTDGNLPIELLDEQGNPVASSGTLSSSRITVNSRNNSIIVSSAPDNLKLIEQLISQLDTPGMVAKIKIFPVINADAAALVETLRSLIPSQSGNSPSGPQLSSSPDEGSLVPLRFTVDTRGNNIIAVGSDGDLKIVEALIVRLDESDTLQRKSTVYQLKNSPAVDIALAVNEFLRSKRQVEVTSTGVVNPFEQLEREVVVVPEPVQNKLILSATPRYYEEISRLIEQLDQQPPQVMIQVMIAEISLGNTHEFGMELGLQSSVLFDRSLLGDLLTRTSTTTTSTPAGVVTETVQEIVAASNTPGFDFNNNPLGNSGSAKSLARSGVVGGQGLSNFSVGRNNDQLGFGGLVLSASSENVSFLLRALQDCRRLEILSRPQVLTLDNQQAFIQVGQRIPRITTANVTQFGFQTGVTLENVGLIIGVTPRISPDGTVVMEIDAEKSKIRPEDEGIPISVAQDGSVIRSPILDTITAQATVSAADGETIILGGLISRENFTNHRKVPWLGDIPILKNLFRYELEEMKRTELLIIMTPHVVRNEADMQRLKQAEFSRMSWCEADIFDIHGDINAFNGPVSHSLESDQWQVVYPDVDPRGSLAPPVQEATPILPQSDTQSGDQVVPVPVDSIQFRSDARTAQLPTQPPRVAAPASALSDSNVTPSAGSTMAAAYTTQPNANESGFSARDLLPPSKATAVTDALFQGSTTNASSVLFGSGAP